MEDNALLNKMFESFSKHVNFSDEEKQMITDLANVVRLKKGDFLLKEGEISNKGFFVLQGCLRVFYLIDGEEKTTSFYTEMESITPHCAVNKQPSAYYISCVVDSIIAAATLDAEPEIAERHPRFETLCRILAENLLAENQASFDGYKTEKFWDSWADKFDKRAKNFTPLPIEETNKYLNNSDIVLDFGCATGAAVIEIADCVQKAVGIKKR